MPRELLKVPLALFNKSIVAFDRLVRDIRETSCLTCKDLLTHHSEIYQVSVRAYQQKHCGLRPPRPCHTQDALPHLQRAADPPCRHRSSSCRISACESLWATWC